MATVTTKVHYPQEKSSLEYRLRVKWRGEKFTNGKPTHKDREKKANY